MSSEIRDSRQKIRDSGRDAGRWPLSTGRLFGCLAAGPQLPARFQPQVSCLVSRVSRLTSRVSRLVSHHPAGHGARRHGNTVLVQRSCRRLRGTRPVRCHDASSSVGWIDTYRSTNTCRSSPRVTWRCRPARPSTPARSNDTDESTTSASAPAAARRSIATVRSNPITPSAHSPSTCRCRFDQRAAETRPAAAERSTSSCAESQSTPRAVSITSRSVDHVQLVHQHMLTTPHMRNLHLELNKLATHLRNGTG